jgi:hypothetical protein
MSFIYTRTQLKERLNAGIQGKSGILSDPNETVNEAVRECFGSGFTDERGNVYPLDFRSARRKVALTPNLYNGVFDYYCPADLNAFKIVDLPAQATRQDGEFALVPVAEFEVNKKLGMLAIRDYNGSRILKIVSGVDSNSVLLSELDSLTSGGGTWEAFGDAETLTADDADFVKGAGSIKWNISSAGGTTAGIKNSSLDSTDLSDYFGGTSSFFIWAKINSATNLTNYILRFGSDSSNYYQKTITTQHDGTAFKAGWNLLRFDISSLTTVGSPDETDITYAAIYMTKTAGKISESDYKFDWLIVKKGVIHDVDYYTKYGWQNSSGTYLENSTAEDDVLVADFDEFQIILQKAKEKAYSEIGDSEGEAKSKIKFREMAKEYMQRNPSEAKIMSYDYYNFI